MTEKAKCLCCKTNNVGPSKVMCYFCWDWLTKEMTMEDVCVVIGHIAYREPDNKYAKAISEYVVADNYMQGKAQLSGLNDKLYSDYWDSIKPQLLKIQRYPSFKEWLKTLRGTH